MTGSKGMRRPASACPAPDRSETTRGNFERFSDVPRGTASNERPKVNFKPFLREVFRMRIDHVYHLDLHRENIEGAKIALLPGDPFRVPGIGDEMKKRYGVEGREVSWKREYRTFRFSVGGEPVLAVSTGIGGPSASIAVEELAMLGVRVFVRVGTTGAIRKDVRVGEVVVTTGSVRLDGASGHYAPPEFPAVAHHEVVNALLEGCRKEGVGFHAGITASSDTFYPGQEREDSFTGYVPRRFRGSMEEWRRLGVLNYEMESATILTMTAAMGLKGGCVTGVVVNRCAGEGITADDLALGERNAVRAAVASIEDLVAKGER